MNTQKYIVVLLVLCVFITVYVPQGHSQDTASQEEGNAQAETSSDPEHSESDLRDLEEALGDLGGDFALEDIKAVEQEMEWLQAETYVITASKVLENIKKSAASITVITDKEIRQMGARHLMDVLRTVPGMGYYYGPLGNYNIDIRGILKNSDQSILLMVNSHPLNENFLGGATWTHDIISVENIKQIEIIRGPGSALYGANAFSGVINIITKDAEEIDGMQVSARGGSYETQQYNLALGKIWNDFEIAFNANYYNTNGFEGDIEQDRQSRLDLLFGTDASLAPGHTQGGDEKYDIALNCKYKGITFDGRYVDRDKDTSIGMLDALNENSVDSSSDYYLTLRYEDTFYDKLDVSGKVYYNHHRYESSYQGLPDGTVIMTPPPEGQMQPVPIMLPEGLIAEPSNTNTRIGADLHFTYKTGDSNTAVAGFTYEKMKQFDVEYSANFLYTPVQGVFIPLAETQDVTVPPYNQNYNQTADRTFIAGFLENIWDIRENLRLNVGARYDHYSDFGGSFNPRAGIVWEFMKGYDIKLLAGMAFRAPTFSELYSQNNPAFVGNPDLNPEKIETYELSLGTELSDAFNIRITGFQNTIKDSIDLIEIGGTAVFQNSDKLRSQGIEIEAKYDMGKGSYLAGNFTCQDAENLDTEEHFWNIPEWKGNLMTNFRVSKYCNFYTGVYFQSGYDREEGDDREDVDGFTLVNTTLIARNFLGELELRGSVYNLFNTEYEFPTAMDTLPVDMPMPGRNFLLEVQYTF